MCTAWIGGPFFHWLYTCTICSLTWLNLQLGFSVLVLNFFEHKQGSCHLGKFWIYCTIVLLERKMQKKGTRLSGSIYTAKLVLYSRAWGIFASEHITGVRATAQTLDPQYSLFSWCANLNHNTLTHLTHTLNLFYFLLTCSFSAWWSQKRHASKDSNIPCRQHIVDKYNVWRSCFVHLFLLPFG